MERTAVCSNDTPPEIQHEPLRPGDACPRCGEGRLDYDGILNLVCPHCGYTIAEGGGCT